jgi:hypothetical protein
MVRKVARLPLMNMRGCLGYGAELASRTRDLNVGIRLPRNQPFAALPYDVRVM